MSRTEKRYVVRMAVFMALYVAILWLVAGAFRRGEMPQGAWLYFAAAAPAVPVAGAIWAMLRYLVDEDDEYRRFLRMRAFLWSTGIALAIMTVWGSLQQFAHVPPMPAMYPFFIFIVCLGLAEGVISWRRR